MARKHNAVKGGAAVLLGCALAASTIVAPASAAPVENGTVITPTEGTTQINLIGINDFHGRITHVHDMAANVLNLLDQFGDENTGIIAVGDMVGASEFESSVAHDDPSKQALMDLGVDVYTAGNHEFDQGQQDALAMRDKWGHMLAANVVKADGSLLLDPYKIIEVSGHTVAVIGGVTTSTPAGVTPSGVEGLTFTDPVEAVNKYADLLTDGDESNGEAEILIASYHEGGPSAGSYEENAQTEIFRHMAEDTSPKVAAIFEAHTHKLYNYDVNGRPVIQAGEYAQNVSQVVLTVDDKGKVTDYQSSIVPTLTGKDEKKNWIPRVTRDQLSPESQAVYDKVAKTQADALAQAEVLGAEQVGVINETISRPYGWSNGQANLEEATRDQESSLGTVIADSMMNWANSVGTEELKADLSIMNPGGIREDMEGDGVLTYKDINQVIPFTNNLAIVSIKGSELKQVFEQQWQVDDKGEVPGRPYLQLALSSNVNYTYQGSIADDPKTTQGSHITSIYIDGKPLEADKVYKVAMPSFLAAGGDNFYALNNNEGVYDTKSVDMEAFVTYVKNLENTELKREDLRNGFNVEGYFADGAAPTIAAGATHTFTVKDVDLHSRDFIANTSVEVMLGDQKIGEAAISGQTANGEVTTAEVTITVPAGTAAGDYTLNVVAQPSGSTVNLPLTVGGSEAPAPAPTDDAKKPQLVTEKENYTAAESAEGIDYKGVNFAANDAVKVTLTTPNGRTQEIEADLPNADGSFKGHLTYQSIEPGTGSVIEDKLPWPQGKYTLTAVQGDVTVTAEFTVGESEGTQPNKGGLAKTGADETTLFIGLGAGALALIAGAAMVVARRRQA